MSEETGLPEDPSQDRSWGQFLDVFSKQVDSIPFNDLTHILCAKNIYHYGARDRKGESSSCEMNWYCWQCNRKATLTVKENK